MKATLKDIAKECGLDISTVSRSLNNDERVKLATKELVKKTAQRLNYKPNLAARSLAVGRTKTIFFLLGSLEGVLDRRAAGFGSSYINSKGFDLYLSLHNSDVNVYERQFKRISLGLTDGAIISPNVKVNSHQMYQDCLRDDIPIIFFDQHFEELKTPVVTSDNAKAVQQLMSNCLAEGVKKFYVLFGEGNSVEKARLGASLLFLKKNKLPYELISPDDIQDTHVNKMREKTIAVISTSQSTIASFIKNTSEVFQNKKIYSACFDQWVGSCYPSKKVFCAIQNYEKMISTAIDKIIEYTVTKKKIKAEVIKVPILKFISIDS